MIFTLENSKIKGPNINSLDPEYLAGLRSLLYRPAHLPKKAFSVRNKLPATSELDFVEKNNYRRRRRTYLIWSPLPHHPPKIVWTSLWGYHWIKKTYNYYFTAWAFKNQISVGPGYLLDP